MIIIVDGNYLAYRTFHKSPPLTNSKGFPTAVIHGVTQTVLSISEKFSPDKMYVVFDAKGKNRRHELYKEYKATRERMPEDLAAQMSELQSLLKLLGYTVMVQEGYEADDVIHTLAINSEEETAIVTKDKDLYQLVNENVRIFDTQKNIFIDIDAVVEKFGVKPEQVLDLLALVGDKSDNIPGVAGIGEKTAAALLNEYENLEGIYENIDKQKGKRKENLVNDKEKAFLSRELARLDVVENLEITENKKDDNAAFNKMTELELKTLLKRVTASEPAPEKADLTEGKVEKPIFYAEINGEIYTCDGEKFEKTEKEDLTDTDKYFGIKQLIKMGKKVSENALGLKVISWMNEPDNWGIRMLKDESEAEFISRLNQSLSANIELLKENSLESLYFDMELPVTYLLAEMEENGVILSKEKIMATHDLIEEKLAGVYEKIKSKVGYEINVSSPKQLSTFLFDELGIKPVKKTKTGFSTNEEALHGLAMFNPEHKETIDDILKYREYKKILSTYTTSLIDYIDEETGRIHADFNQTGTATGRLSSTNPNMQNLPQKGDYGKAIREAFVAPEGYSFVSLDYSQIELRILAHLTEDENLLKAYRNDEDIHSLTASNIFHTEIDEVTPEMRRMAKAVNFGIIYGLSSYGLSRDTGVSPGEASVFIEEYFRTYPGVSEFIEKVTKESKVRGYGETICGRKRFIKDINSRNKTVAKRGERVAVNTPMQGSAADIIKLAMISCDKLIKNKGYNAKLVLQLHDELVFEVKDEEVQIIFPELKEAMESVIELKVPLVVNGSFGKNLGELK